MAAVSRFAGASQVRRLFENAPSVVSAKLSLTLGEEMDAVLGVVSKTLEHLELFDFRKNRRGGAMFDFPCLRSLVYASYVMNEDDRTLSRIVSKLPDLEDLSLNLLTSDGFDAAKLLGPELLCKVRTWIVHSQPAFRALCSVSSFRPRRIVVEREMDDVFGYERSELDEQTVEAISKLPSLQELELDHVASRLVVDYGLPPDLEKLSIKDLEVTAHECDDGVATLAGILGSRPGLRLHVRNVIAAAEESGGFSEECQEEIDLWTQYNVDVAELNPTFDESSSEASSFEDDE
ncbi:hypothetical protein DFJ74DRAFT_654558 [Hyaloraphidium curvatum]|nr:hypothetical protein DFJ74DRAFT_654558 [Hyaloraphidium curvatum]